MLADALTGIGNTMVLFLCFSGRPGNPFKDRGLHTQDPPSYSRLLLDVSLIQLLRIQDRFHSFRSPSKFLLAVSRSKWNALDGPDVNTKLSTSYEVVLRSLSRHVHVSLSYSTWNVVLAPTALTLFTLPCVAFITRVQPVSCGTNYEFNVRRV